MYKRIYDCSLALLRAKTFFFQSISGGFCTAEKEQMKRVTFRVDRSRVCNWTFMCLDYLQKSL